MRVDLKICSTLEAEKRKCARAMRRASESVIAHARDRITMKLPRDFPRFIPCPNYICTGRVNTKSECELCSAVFHKLEAQRIR